MAQYYQILWLVKVPIGDAGSAGQRLPGGPVLPDPLAFQQRLEIGNCREQALALQTQHLWQGLSGPGPGRQVPPNGTADLLTSAPAAGGHPLPLVCGLGEAAAPGLKILPLTGLRFQLAEVQHLLQPRTEVQRHPLGLDTGSKGLP